MTLEQDIEEIKRKVGNLSNKDHTTERTGLYILVATAALFSYGAQQTSDTNYDALKAMKLQIEAMKPQVQVENVIGYDAPEKFYEIDGQRVYLEIDGKPVGQYVKEIKTEQPIGKLPVEKQDAPIRGRAERLR
ncbi:hypothetical protein GOV03_04470 [Candidatus Woesearchaeota archaeon]|nr:hypothetical protein [Candidatus Woesearchaeota archaeon]